MTRKDYIKIAEILSEARGRRDLGRMESLLLVTSRLANMLEEDNSNFNRQKFLVASMAKDEA